MTDPTPVVVHPRTTIRNKFVSLLTGQTTAGSRVYNSRTQAVSTLPALRVFTRSDEFVEWRHLDGGAHRMVEVSVECLVSDNNEATAAEECDDLCREVEKRMNSYPDVDGTALLRTLGSTDIEHNDNTDPPVVMGTVNFQVEYVDNFS